MPDCCFSDSKISIISIPTSHPASLKFSFDKVNKRFKTEDYSVVKTQGRATFQQIDLFLKEVSGPLSSWYEQYGRVYETSGRFMVLLIFFCLILPFGFCYLFWLDARKREAKERLIETQEKFKLIIHEKEIFFAQKGLVWNIPEDFPGSIELVIRAPGSIENQEKSLIVDEMDLEMINRHQIQDESTMVSYDQTGYPL